MKGEEGHSASGIYLHVPFCHQACSYCDFYFSVQKKYIPDFVRAVLIEIELRKHFLARTTVQTLYFGGGTPSLLNHKALGEIYQALLNNFQNFDLKEVTIECNPEDITEANLSFWKGLGINRLSLGVQSIHEHELKRMNRRHSPKQIHQALSLIEKAGFSNYNVDILYGLPESSLLRLKETLDAVLAYRPTHISCYALTVEPRTLLNHQVLKGEIHLKEEDYLVQYEFLVDYLGEKGYYRYEISNFALMGFEALHNSAYWQHKPYLGLGPSAHSYYPHERASNIRNLHRYVELLYQGQLPVAAVENLTAEQVQLEKLMFQVRQNRGLRIEQVPTKFLKEWQTRQWITLQGNKVFFTSRGLMLSDSLILYLGY